MFGSVQFLNASVGRDASSCRKNDNPDSLKSFVVLNEVKDLRTDFTANLYKSAEMLRRSLSMTSFFILRVIGTTEVSAQTERSRASPTFKQ